MGRPRVEEVGLSDRIDCALYSCTLEECRW